MISEDFVRELLHRLDIVSVLRPYLDLKKVGANYVACCPFHSEKTPSFTVSPAKQFYHCFGCGAHGTAISFMMRHSRLPFPEAVTKLSSMVGLTVPISASLQNDKNKGLSEWLSKAVSFYREQLLTNDAVLSYLTNRGLQSEVLERFNLGFAPNSYQNLRIFFRSQYSLTALQEVGLVSKSSKGGLYDRFRNRIMFPIRSFNGDFIGFGGRVLTEGVQPKYLNSPDTTLFRKGHELYGLYENSSFVRKERSVIVVEGYMDLLSLNQHGINNVVASLGTACTLSQTKLLFRYADTIYYCFDGDDAGRKAAIRVAENTLSILPDGKQVYFLLLPKGEDPDSYVASHGSRGFQEIIFKAKPLSLFLIDDWRLRYKVDTVEGRALMVHDLRAILSKINAPIFRAALVHELSSVVDIPDTHLSQIFSNAVVDGGKYVNNSKEMQASVHNKPRFSGRRTADKGDRYVPSLAQRVARLLLSRPGNVSDFPRELLNVESEEFYALRDLVLILSDLPAKEFSIENLSDRLKYHPRSSWFSRVFSLSSAERSDEEWAVAFKEYCLALKRNCLEEKYDHFLKLMSKRSLNEAEKEQFISTMTLLKDIKCR
ncbi:MULTISPECIES: DNA primase [Candidatus Ichthyocystis]|uniref:DNA primase n=1 Tax=Candidatus Ichthyocystis TaxID=2929841 RepID=UPI000A62DDCF|nr:MULTISPECIES: DNA primase [Ichthyocystis]